MAEAEQDVEGIARRVFAAISPWVRSHHSCWPSELTSQVPPESIRTARDLAPYLDHTLLKAKATGDEIIQLVREARDFKFAGVCVNSAYTAAVASALKGTQVATVATVGFPLGAMATSAKAFEAGEAVRNGAGEIDMVINLGALKSGELRVVFEDIAAVVDAAQPAPVKVILETGELSWEEKISVCVVAKVAGAAFVKTSTGFGPGGATIEDVSLLRSVVKGELGVKASGGIRTAAAALKMIRAGANRIGTSNSIAMVSEPVSF